MNLVEYVSGSPMNRTDPLGLQASPSTPPGSNQGSMFSWFPACAAFSNSIWYIDHTKEEEEGTLFGVIWSDGGSCKKSRKWVHVRLFFSTRVSDGLCHPRFEGEIDQYDPKFFFGDSSLEDAGCDKSDPGTIHKSPNWRKGDCSYVTWAWKCPVTCIKIDKGEKCSTPTISTVIKAKGFFNGEEVPFSHALSVTHSVDYRDQCCGLSPCTAQLTFEQIFGL